MWSRYKQRGRSGVLFQSRMQLPPTFSKTRSKQINLNISKVVLNSYAFPCNLSKFADFVVLVGAQIRFCRLDTAIHW